MFEKLDITTNKNNAKLKLIRKLQTKQGRKKSQLIVCEGYRHCSLVNEPEFVLFSDDQSGAAAYAALANNLLHNYLDVPCMRVPSSLLSEISAHKTAPGVLVVAKRPAIHSVDRLRVGERLVVLEDIADPYNCGTIIRTADALGLTGVVITENTVDPFSPKAQQGAMGSEFHLPIYRVAGIDELYSRLNELDIKLVVADLSGVELSQISESPDSFALVVGNEGHGISQAARDLAEYTITIPLQGAAESLNAAMAFGIIAYKLLEFNQNI